MGDLHSIPCNHLQFTCSTLDYSDFHNLGLLNTDMSSLFMESTPPIFTQLDQSDLSSGYLQDALLEFSSKRRRLKFCNENDPTQLFLHHNLYNSDCSMNGLENYDYLSQIMTKSDSTSGELFSRNSEEISNFPEAKSSEEALSNNSDQTFEASSSCFHKDTVNSKSSSDKETLRSIFPSAAGNLEHKRKKSSMIPKVVYPFAVVKPGGHEGDVTLNDINERILMPPTRPVRHPVGEFACRPIVSPDGPGLSGKEVVALTRIHTQGRGTVTIIRTKD